MRRPSFTVAFMALHLTSRSVSSSHSSVRSLARSSAQRLLVLFAALGLAAVGCSSDGADTASSAVGVSASVASKATVTTSSGDADPADDPDLADADLDEDETASEEEPVTDEEPTFELVGDIALDTAEVNELVAFVELTTGRDFVRPPVIVSQSPEEFAAQLIELTPEEEAEALDQSALLARAYQVLGLSDQTPTELFSNIQTFAASPDGVLGYYDPDSDELYVPNLLDPDANVDDFRGLLVHELTHALDGQYVDLAAVLDNVEADADAFFDSAFGDRALVEGRAVAVQQLFIEAEGITPAVPPVPEYDVPLAYVSSLVLPYQVGGGWVMGNGGPAGSWDLYDEELPTSEAMLFGTTAGDEVEVTAPAASSEAAALPVIDDGTVGATGIFVWLAGDEVGAGPAVTAAIDAAMGWGGDGYVLVGDDETTCIAATFVGDTEADLAEIESAFTTWADDAPTTATRTVSSDGETVTVEGCAPFLQ